MSRHRDPLPSRLTDAILSLQPTALWPMDDGNGPLRDIAGGNWNAAVTGTLAYRTAAASLIERAVTGTGTQYGVTSTSVPNPTTAMSVVSLISTTDATAANRAIIGRYSAGAGASWRLMLDTAHKPNATMFTNVAGTHVSWNANVVVNTGAWWLVAFSFTDAVGGTVWASNGSTLVSGASGVTSGAWNPTSSAAIHLGANGTFAPFPGSWAKQAYFRRALTETDVRYLASVAFGG